MPDSFGKRQRDRAKAQKASEKQERRLARKQQKAERSGDESDWLADPVDPNDIAGPPRDRGASVPPADETQGAGDQNEESPQNG